MFYSRLYLSDIATIKKYGDKFKFTHHRIKMQSGFELNKQSNRCKVHSEKLDNNISRAKAKIMEYGLCNDWDYFVTLTLDSKKYDRYNLQSYIKDLGQFLNNYNKRQLKDLPNIRYVLIPEQHDDGAWHLHGLISNLPESHLSINQNGYLDWKSYSDKFGYMSLGKIKSKEKVSRYITKYVSKDLSVRSKELNAKLYYCSKGLKTSILVIEGKPKTNIDYDFENDYVKIKWFDNFNDAFNSID